MCAKFLGAEPVEPEPNTLAGKLFAVDPTHPCAAEAVDVITGAGDHVCVDTPDVFARFHRMNGRNVLHTMGFDAFGLPAEQFAVQTGQHPRKTTEENIGAYLRQFRRLGRQLTLTGLPEGLERILLLVSAQGLARAVEEWDAASPASRSFPAL